VWLSCDSYLCDLEHHVFSYHLRTQVPGVVGFFSARDVPGSNLIGPVVADEEVFASEFVTCVGQVRLGVLWTIW
jgi:xanthine dehydrogenase molybdopterin-binding subunit B